MRLIDADALRMRLNDLEARGGHAYYRKGMDDTLHYFMPKIIKDAPTVDPEELRPKGRWEVMYTCRGERLWGFECDQCGAGSPKTSNYCPHCGCKMEVKNENNT